MTPGTPRLIASETIPMLYPGEKAVAAGFRVEDDHVIITSWMIEPMPGWRGRWLRWRYRLFGRWMSRGDAPRLKATFSLREGTHDDEA